MRTEIVIRATRTQNVLGEKGRRIRELTSWVQKRFNFPEGNVELYAERSATPFHTLSSAATYPPHHLYHLYHSPHSDHHPPSSKAVEGPISIRCGDCS